MINENIRTAFQSFAGNKLRTLLSMVGIVIGVASVVAITAYGASASESIKRQIAKSGLETIMVMMGRDAGGESLRLFKEELAPELEEIEGVLQAMPVNQRSVTFRAGKQSATDTIVTALPGFVPLFDIEAAEGRFLSEADLTERSPVVVLGAELAATLFPSGGAVGSYLRVLGQNPQQLRIVGVLAKKSDAMGMNFDSTAFVPRTTYLTRIARPARPDRFIVRADGSKDPAATAKRIETFFFDLTGKSNAARVMSPSTVAETLSGVTDTLTTFLTGVAAISLVVGGIGIMNIMLVSVTERTREIGIRKAVGAPPRAILSQFLVEAVVLTGTGGLLGVAVGAGASYAAVKALSYPFVISPAACAVAWLVSAGTGIFFGLYPAARAARLDPVAALSYE
ncbi:MAG: ABC transporter permease [Spirochaetaceae bacterium]|nr:ABC transporter permease [Spirochaetaceae bacterium]